VLLGHLRLRTIEVTTSMRDFLACAQGETREWNKKRAKRSTHTNHTNKKMVADLSVGKSHRKTRRGKKKEKVDIDEKKNISKIRPKFPTP